MESSDHLCSDVIFEILTRTSFETLSRCKLVCKSWNRVTYDSSFMNLFCRRTSTISGFFIQSMASNKYSSNFVSSHESSLPGLNVSLDFLPHNVKIEACSKQGILCCLSRRDRHCRYYVCKPSTRQLQSLPNPKMRYNTEKVAMVVLRSNPLRYKIFRLSSPRHLSTTKYYNYGCEIFDSDTWSWKQLQDTLLPYGVIFTTNPTIFVCGTIHWLASNNNVLAFNEEQETYTTFPLPKPLCDDKLYTYKQLMEYQGRLALCCNTPEWSLELWVMEDYTDHVWKKRQVLSVESLKRVEPYSSPTLAAFCNADTALMMSFKKVIFYKMQEGNFKVIRMIDLNDPCEVFAFQSDLKPTDLRCGG
ncbi:unnamed protein product [Ilex paraguariensis]|uniref:F-box domain-containing protein n=1 Tax=Ilex paraguariensis TaxID=185542 RepID=A0ABC8RGU0_9AQUA